jgi:hypothetical protein
VQRDVITRFGNWLRWKVDEFDGPTEFSLKAKMKSSTLQAMFRYADDSGLRAKSWGQLERGAEMSRQQIQSAWKSKPLPPHPKLESVQEKRPTDEEIYETVEAIMNSLWGVLHEMIVTEEGEDERLTTLVGLLTPEFFKINDYARAIGLTYPEVHQIYKRVREERKKAGTIKRPTNDEKDTMLAALRPNLADVRMERIERNSRKRDAKEAANSPHTPPGLIPPGSRLKKPAAQKHEVHQ